MVRGVGGIGSLYVTNGAQWVMLSNTSGQSGSGSTSDGKSSVEYWHVLTPFIMVEVSGAGANDDVRFQMTDPRGRVIQLDPQSYNSVKNRRVYVERIRPKNGVESMNLEIIISRPLEFEFMIDPKEIKPAQSARP